MSGSTHVFRWDLDKTYLQTDFDSAKDLWKTARLQASERQNIPGSAALIRAIRDRAPDGQKSLVYFVSGSPEQMRKVLEEKFSLDGVTPDSFVLKPTLKYLLRGEFKAVRGQFGFKLGQMLAGRAEVPVGSTETLFGDDAESDALVYTLYADLISGRMSSEDLRAFLRSAEVYETQLDEIMDWAESIVREDPVTRILIHLARKTPPAEFRAYSALVVPVENHLQSTIQLVMDGTLMPTAIADVYDSITSGDPGIGQSLFQSAQAFLRLRSHLTQRRDAERFLESLRSEAHSHPFLELLSVPIGDFARRAPDTLPHSAPSPYGALLKQERRRRDALERLRKSR